MKKLLVIFGITATIVACNAGEGEGGGSDTTSTAAMDQGAPTGANPYEKGLELIGAGDCTTCHAIDKKNIGPSYVDVAKKYENTDEVKKELVSKIINGGAGNWGAVPMTPHPSVSEADAMEMVNYIMSLKNR